MTNLSVKKYHNRLWLGFCRAGFVPLLTSLPLAVASLAAKVMRYSPPKTGASNG